MATTERALAVKFVARNQEQVLAALRQLGQEGERAAQQIERSFARPAGNVVVLDRAMRIAGDTASRLAAQAAAVNAPIGAIATGAVAAGSAFTGLAATLGGVVIGIQQLNRAAAASESLKKLADDLGVTTQQLQALEFAGVKAKIEVEQLRQGLAQFQARAFDAQSGRGRAEDIFKQIGLSAREANGEVKSTFELLGDVAERLKEFDRADRLTIVRSLFGDDRLLPLLERGRGGIADMAREAEALGLVLRSDVVEPTAKFAENLRVAEEIVGRRFRVAITESLAALLRVNDALGEAAARLLPAREEAEKIDAALGRTGDAVAKLATPPQAFLDWLGEASRIAGGLRDQFLNLFRGGDSGDVIVPIPPRPGDDSAAFRAAYNSRLANSSVAAAQGRRLRPPGTGGADNERSRALEEIARLEAEVARIGLEGIDLIDARYQEHLARFRKLHAEKKIELADFVRADLALTEKAEKEKAELARREYERALDEQLRANERAAEEALRPWLQFGDTLIDLFARAGAEGGKALGANLAAAGRGFGLDLARAALQPLMTQLAGFVGGGSLNIGGSNLGGIRLPVGQANLSAGEIELLQRAGAALPGASLGSAFGAGLQGFGVGSTLGGLFPRALNQTGSSIGGAIGGIAGLALTPILGPLGPILGGLAGGALGGLFGPKGGKKPIPRYAGGLVSTAGGVAARYTLASNYAEDLGAGGDFADALAGALNAFAKSFRATLGRASLNYAVDAGGFRVFSSDADQRTFGAGGDAGLAIARALQGLGGEGFFAGLSGRARTALGRSRGGSVEELIADVEFADRIEEVIKGLEAVNDNLKAIELQARTATQEQVKSISAFVERAEALGVGAEGRAGLGVVAAGLLDFVREDVSEETAAFARLSEHFRVVREEADKLGLTLDAVAAAETRERAELQLRLAQSSGLNRFFEELQFGGLSGAAPGASLEGRRASFLAAVAQGQTGRFEELGRGLLESSRGFYASGAGFQADLALVRSAVADALGGNAFVAPIVAAVNDNGALLGRVLDELSNLRRITEAQAEEIASLTALLRRAA
jgi:hypothetical protein